MDINMEELMSLSEDENDAEEEWRPDKERRVSKKSKVTGVSSQTPTCGLTWSQSCDHVRP